jgi:glycyl-tRNA synthetase alpha chain
MTCNFNGREGADPVTYGDVFLQAEQEYSRAQFRARRHRDAAAPFRGRRGRMRAPSRGRSAGDGQAHRWCMPAYDQCIKASHVFNLLDARGVISVTERQAYILRVRNLSRQCGEAFLLTDAGGANYRPAAEAAE